MKRLLCAGFLLALVGCPDCSNPCPPGSPISAQCPNGGGDAGDDGGDTCVRDDAGCGCGYCISTLDPAPMALISDYIPQISAAQGPSGRIGIAYFKEDAGVGADGGVDISYAIQYVEWSPGATTFTPEVVQITHLAYGLSVAFQANGQPAVAYLGGPPDIAGVGVYWLNHDTAISYRSGGGTWTQQIAVQTSGEAPTFDLPNSTSDQGAVVGLYPGLVFNGSTAYLVYRDVHNAQSVGTGDYNGSDFEVAYGGPSSWSHLMITPGGNNKQGWSGHPSLIMANGRAAAAVDRVYSPGGQGAPSASGSDVYFVRQGEDGGIGWTFPARLVSTAGDTGNGPSLAQEDGGHFGIAFQDKIATGGQSFYLSESYNDGKTWLPRDTVPESGSTGWYPSLAFDPTTADPVIAFYQCAIAFGVGALANCPASQDELRTAWRIFGNWYFQTVDSLGAVQPKLFIKLDGKRIITYRDPRKGTIKIAVEQ